MCMKEKRKNEIIAADFETVIMNNKGVEEHIVYAIGWKDIYTKEEKVEYIESNSDFNESSNLLLFKFMKSLFSMNRPIVYFHNMGGFDGIFILKWAKLNEMEDKVKILSRNTTILKIKIGNVEFRDSYRILPASLDNLANILLGDKKIDFDHECIKSLKDCLYMRETVEKYLRKDVDILSRVIYKSSMNILEEFNINIFEHLTTASLSLEIYKLFNKHHINTIEKSKGYKDMFIRNGYYGGLCNVMKPDLKDGYHYDVNSLYPYIMANFEMPLGKGVWVNSINDIEEIKDMFGFIEVEVETITPCLPIGVKNKGLITPTGKFSGVFFSEELKLALDYGCKIIKFKKALIYKDKKIIFRKFINNIYSKRLEAKKRGDSVNQYILKLIMNSLYGRFGLGTDISIMEFIDSKYYAIYKHIFNVANFNEDLGFISFVIKNIDVSKKLFDEWCSENNIKAGEKKELRKKIIGKYSENGEPYRAVQISAAIASYARITMWKDMEYCWNNGVDISYMDTDSLFVDKPIPEEMVSKNKLGYYKLENKINEGVFLAPKAYAYKSDSEEEIKLKGIEKDKQYLSYDMIKEIRIQINKNHPNKKWKFEYIKPVYRMVNQLKIVKKEQVLELKFESYKFERIFDKNGNWIACKPPHLN